MRDFVRLKVPSRAERLSRAGSRGGGGEWAETRREREEHRARRFYARWLSVAILPVVVLGIALSVVALAFRGATTPAQPAVPGIRVSPSGLLPPGQIQVVGSVFTIPGGSPIEGAQVFLMAQSLPMLSTTTDAAGKFDFPPMATSVLDHGPLHIQINAQGLGSYNDQLRPNDRDRMSVNIGLPQPKA